MMLGRRFTFACAVVAAVLGSCATGEIAPPPGGDDASAPGCPACTGNTPLCDSATKTCVGCLGDGDCADAGAGAKCDTTTHTCKPQCTTDNDCTDPGAKKCDTTQHVCVACLTTNDTCPGGSYCAKAGSGATSCQPGCKTDGDCTATDGGVGTPACCNHQCADVTADGKNCGACGTACGSTQLCCASSCLESQTSVQNCGACGKTCSPANVTTAECTAGACAYDTCTTGFGDCDNDKTNGCETNLTNDNAHCGLCGTACTGSQKCVASTCVSCGPNEVAYNGHCYYLDGSGGACDSGFARAAEAVLSTIAPQFVGKNYEHTVSSNCCIWTSDATENWGMAAHCNANGPFTAGDPQLGAFGCTGVQNQGAGQLTFCGSN